MVYFASSTPKGDETPGYVSVDPAPFLSRAAGVTR
jgi:hypothetical protein